MRLLAAAIVLYVTLQLSAGAVVKAPVKDGSASLSTTHSSAISPKKRSILQYSELAPDNQDLGSLLPGVRDVVKISSHKSHPNTLTVGPRKDVKLRHRRQANGGLDFGDLPMIPAIVSIVEFGQDALQHYYNLAGSFINTIRPGPLPYELFTSTVSNLVGNLLGTQNGLGMNVLGDPGGSGGGNPLVKRQVNFGAGGFDIEGILKSFVTWLVPILVVAGLGLVFAILFPLVGCCFCCWRCCGKCGANNYKFKTKHEFPKCIILSIIFLVVHLILLIGIILGFLSNAKISSAIKGYPDTVRNAVTDTVNYVNGTVNEVVFLADNGLNTVFDTVTSDIQNISTVLGNPLELALKNGVNPFLNTSNLLLDNLDLVHQSLIGLNGTIDQTESLSVQLNDSLLILQEAISNLTTECMGNPVCVSAVPQFQATDVTVNANTAPLNTAFSILNAVDINGTRSLINSSTAILSNISGLLGQQLSNFSIPLNASQLSMITSIVRTVQQSVDQIVSSNGTIGEINNGINQAAMYLEVGDQYRSIAFIVILVAIFLIWVLFLMGMVCGVFGYSRKAIPYDRSAVSNCGARLLFMGIAICFVTCGLLLILATLMFLLASSIQLICNDLAPPRYTIVQRLVDDPNVWGGNTLLGSVLQSLARINANVSASELLRSCEQNQPLYAALQVETFLDIDAVLSPITNLTSQFDLGSLNLGSFFTYTSNDFVPASVRMKLDDLASNSSSIFNFSSITQQLNSTALDSLNIQEVSTNLTTLANFFGSNNFTGAENQTLSIRDDLVGTQINRSLMAIQAELDRVQSAVSSLEMISPTLSPLVQQMFNQLDSFLNSTGTIANNEVDKYANTLTGYFSGFINFTVNQVKNEIGRCRPLTVAYAAVHKSFCVNTIDGVNGVWFSIGWCVLFLVPIIISTAIITTYFRKSKTNIDFSVRSSRGEVISNPELLASQPTLRQDRNTLHTPETLNTRW